ncbi:hypothetical protein PYW08_013011 [Mythimna loreyi]|uniref:Uncharacterized protein n=1 Tax=Mythimna loreyi TaxID=667449 RepID=A0ACC2PZ04_9NEOP|nr:hypothetical protein PYW08_013011 [Mythimna loreyi]
MNSKKPPDPDPPDDLFDLSPGITVTLPYVTEVPPQDTTMDTENSNRKRVAGLPPATSNKPPKIAKSSPGRLTYTMRDNPPYIVHVPLKNEQTAGTVLQPIKFAEDCFPSKKAPSGKLPSPPWWDRECTDMIRARNEAEKTVNCNMNLENLLSSSEF